MRTSSPIDAVANAINHAALVALPDITYLKNDHAALRRLTAAERMAAMSSDSRPQVEAKRRPELGECEVYAMFMQIWGSTALGFGGLGGAAMTSAYTVIVQGPSAHLAVYWSGRLAYVIDTKAQTDEQREAFLSDVQNRHTCSAMAAGERYGAMKPSPQK